MSEIITYGNKGMKQRFVGMGFTQFTNVRPTKPSNYRDIILLQDRYDLDFESLSAPLEIERLRQYGCTNPIVVVFSYQLDLGPRGQVIKNDPLVRCLSILEIIDKHNTYEQLLSLFDGFKSITTEELQLLYEDFRRNIYSEEEYVSQWKHRLLSKIDVLDHKKEILLSDYCLQEFKALNRWLRRVPAYSRYKVRVQEVEDRIAEAVSSTELKEIIKDFEEKLRFSQNNCFVGKGEESQTGEIILLYVTENTLSFDKLNHKIKIFQTGWKVSLLHASNLVEAERIYQKNEKITRVISDYRFWNLKSGRAELYNGLTVINQLSQIRANARFAYLTHMKVEQVAFHKKAGMSAAQCFSKSLILDRNNAVETYRLLVFLTKDELANVLEDTWPKAISTHGNGKRNPIVDLYETELLYHEYRRSRWVSIRKNAAEFLNELWAGESESTRKYCVLKRFESTWSYLQRTLVGRLVMLTIMNVNRLPDSMINLLPGDEGRQRHRIDIIAYVLYSGGGGLNPGGLKVSSKNVSNYMLTFGLPLKGVYTVNSQSSSLYLLSTERNFVNSWLNQDRDGKEF